VRGNITFERIDVMNLPELPKGWVWVRLENCVDILDSQRIPVNADEREKRISGKPFHDLIPYYGATGQVGWIDDYIFDKELVLLGEDGAPFFEPEKNKAYIIKGRSWVNNHVHVLKAREGIALNSFVCHYLNIFNYHGYVTGTTRHKLNQASLRRIPIPIPPLAEQKRIVEKIEELFTRLDAGVEALKKVKAQIRRYRQAVLKYAFEGKLTEEWRKHAGANYGVGPENIKKGKHIGSPIQDDLSPLPEGWVWVRLGEVAGEVEMVNPKKNPDKEFLYIDIAAIDNKKQSIVNTKIYSGKNAPSRARQLVKSGDILFSTVRTYLKNIAIVNEAYDGQIASTGFCVIRPKTNINSRFIFWYVQTDDFLNPLNQLQRGTNYPAVRDSDVFEQPLPLPPLPEQRQIVSEIERRFSVSDEVEKVVDQSLKQAERLKQSILKKAFEGKLVPQNPNDEPAERLLERIRLKEDKNIKDHKVTGII
jgi:type I restriction enzyme S subunit